MKKHVAFLLALVLVSSASGCSAGNNQKNVESVIVSNLDEELPVSINNSSEVLLLNSFSYGEWTSICSFETNEPYIISPNDTCRIICNDYTVENDGENNLYIMYKYHVEERMRTSLYEKATLSKDETGKFIISDKSGEIVKIDDNNYTEWQDKERFSATEPSTIYTDELERVISDEYEVTTDENGSTKIIFHYIRQTRQHK